VALAGGKGSDVLPGHIVVLAQLVGSGSQRAIAGRSAVGSGERGCGWIMDNHVLAGSSDVGGACGHAAQDCFVSIAAISGDYQVAGCGSFAAQDFQSLEGLAVEVLLFERLAIGLVLLGTGVFRRLGGSWGVEEINGHHTGVSVVQRPCGGELEVALGVNEVGLKRGSERVAFPAAAMDLFAGFAVDGVVEGDHQRNARGKVIYQRVAHPAEKNRLVHAFLGVETVISGPVGMLAATGANEIADRALDRAEKQAKHVLMESRRAGRRAGGGKRR